MKKNFLYLPSVQQGYRKPGIFITALVIAWMASEILLQYSTRLSLGGLRPRYYLISMLMLTMFFWAYDRSASSQNVNFGIKKTTFSIFIAVALFAINAVAVSAFVGRPMEISFIILLLILPIVIFFTSKLVTDRFPFLILTAILVVTTVSSVFSLMQFLNIEAAWDARSFFADDVASGRRENSRNLGLASQGVRAAELKLMGVCIAIAFFTFAKEKRLFWLFIAGLNMAAIFATNTRSAILALPVIFLIAAVVRYPAGRLKTIGFTLLSSIILGGLALYALQFSDSRIATISDTSAQSRILFLKLAAQLIAEQPFGYGANSFSETSLAMFQESNISFGDADNSVGDVESHNFFVNILFYYGVQGLVLMLGLLFFFLSIGRRMIRFEDVTSQMIGLILISNIVSKTIDGLFHNTGPFNGFSGLLMIFGIGLSFYYRGVQSKLNRAKGIEPH